MYAYNETVQKHQIGIIGVHFFPCHHRHIFHTFIIAVAVTIRLRIIIRIKI